MNTKNFWGVILLSCLVTVSGAAADTLDYIDSYLRETMKEKKITGMAASIVMDGEIVVSRGYGYRDRQKRSPATKKTLFPVGSITKLFTATAVTQLAERGKIDLDTPISVYLPNFSIQSRDRQVPTVRQVLTHHSGLPSNLISGFEVERPGLDTYRNLPKLLHEATMVSTPDTAFAYSNTGYSLLGCIIEEVSGLSYREYIEKNIFLPLDMKDSLAEPPEEKDPRITLGYEKRKALEVYPIRDIAAGALLSTSDDMARFMCMIMGKGTLDTNKIIEPDTFEAMISRQNSHVPLDRDFSIGLGYWLIDPIGFDGERLASHGGDLPPFHSILISMPEAGIGVFLCANSAGANGVIIQMASHIVKTLYTAKTGRDVTPIPLPAEESVPKNTMAELAGYYVSPMGLMEVKAGKTRMKMKLGRIPLRMIYHGDNLFSLQIRLLGIIPVKMEILDSLRLKAFRSGGKQYIQIAAAGVSAGVAQRFEPVPVDGSWKERPGRYEILNPLPGSGRDKVKNVRLTYDKKDGLILMHYRFVGQKISVPLITRGSREAVMAGIGSGLGDTISVSEMDGQDILLWSGLYLRNIN